VELLLGLLLGSFDLHDKLDLAVEYLEVEEEAEVLLDKLRTPHH
jgi:hypothetical protein